MRGPFVALHAVHDLPDPAVARLTEHRLQMAHDTPLYVQGRTDENSPIQDAHSLVAR